MANTLIINFINVSVEEIEFEVGNRVISGNLTEDNIILKKLDKTNMIFINYKFKLTWDSELSIAKIVPLKSNNEIGVFDQDDYILLQIVDNDMRKSNRSGMNFKMSIGSNLIKEIIYELSEEAGMYKLKLDSINDIELNNIVTQEFYVCPKVKKIIIF